MLIIDLQQVMIATLMRQLGAHQNSALDENMLRHMILNVLRSYRQKFAGEMIIACDGARSWRKNVFPYYKANRAKNRDESPLDWKMIFETFGKVRSELKEFFPYRVIEVEGAEADDIIGVLAQEFGADGGLIYGDLPKIIIMSGDHDFKQLQRYGNVKQYDPIKKKYIQVVDPDAYLKEHIIRGDVGDGVPNFLSDDDCLVKKVRQKSIQEVKLKEWLKQSMKEICDGETKLRNWKRNEQMVDLRYTPENIRASILSEYHAQAGKDRSKLVNYFIAKKLKHLQALLPEF